MSQMGLADSGHAPHRQRVHHGRQKLHCDASLWPQFVKPNSSRTAAGRKSPATTVAPPTVSKPVPPEQLVAPTIRPSAPPLAGPNFVPSLPSLPSQVQQMSEFASQLITSFAWPTLYPQGSAEQAEDDSARRLDRAQLPDISACLQSSVGVFELKQMRKLAHLTGLTYKMATVTPRAMRRRHGLELVTTSWACEIRGYEHAATAEETLEEGDGMGVSVADARTSYYDVMGRNPPPGAVPLSNIMPVPPAIASAATPAAPLPTASTQQQPQTPITSTPQQQQPQPQPKRWSSPAEMVAGMVSDAAAAATAVAAQPLASAAGSLYAGLASLPIASALGSGPRSSAPAAAAALMSAAAKAVASSDTTPNGQRNEAARLAAAAGPAAIAAAPGSGTRLAAPVQSTTGSPACPSEWFVCDEPAICTRYFVIQGSDTIDHWKLNLTFDPVTFEDAELGIKVHRGAYEAAEILYERFLPMVYEHLDVSPFAKICFTGHSIGGSLGTLLMLMYYYRGVLPAASIANVYTFGAPAVFCMDGGAPEAAARAHHLRNFHHHHHHHLGSSDIQLEGPYRLAPVPGASGPATSGPPAACSCGSGCSPLAAVGLPEHIVRNVIMARDIVPRAFVCDYSLVADILKGWGPSFKGHAGLAHSQHKHMYFFAGRMMVMQPDSWHSFNSDPYHPMLPPQPDLYLIGNPPPAPPTPAPAAPPAAERQRNASPPAQALSPEQDALLQLTATTAPDKEVSDALAVVAGSASPKGASGAPGASKAQRPKIRNEAEALFAIMDNPHPLDVLADPGAYLEKGSISRYHNPDNYTAALGRLIYLKRVQEGRIPSWNNHSYSRALGMEAREQEEEAGASPTSVTLWDSSDNDIEMPHIPAMADPLQELAAASDN